MGTKVHSKSYLPGYYSMRDLNDDSSSSSWPVHYGDNATTNGQYYNGFVSRTVFDGYPGYGKDALKQKMLEHEAVFKNQVYELHRLYRIQRDMMEEVKRNELHRIQESMEPSSSSSLRGSQLPSEDARKWHMVAFPLYKRTSISEVEIVNSPMSCTKGNNVHPRQFPFQNGSLKDSELSNSRPLKVRKKLFDLELPADEYIDTEEVNKSPGCKVSDVSSYAPNGNLKGEHESRVAASPSTSCLRNSIRFADLNEPIEIEETMAPSSTDFRGLNQSAGYLDVNEEMMHKGDGFFISSSVESKVIERGQLSHIYEAGSSKSNFDFVTHGLQQDKLRIPSSRVYPTGHIKEDSRRDRNQHGLECSDRSRNHSNNRHLEEPFSSSSYFASSWAHTVSSWARPTNSFTQKITTSESCLNSAECHETFGGKWRVGELPMRNGFYHGSTSGLKELNVHLPSAGFDYVNCSRGVNMASDSATNHGFGYFPKGSCRVDSRPAIDINLNEVVSKSSSNEEVIVQDIAMIDEKRKPEDHPSALPWLKNNRANFKKVASSESKIEISENRSVKKILGFPIFEKNEPPSNVSTLASGGCVSNGSNFENGRKNRIIDINLEVEPEEETAAEERIVEKEKQTNGASIRDYIDLNSCVTDCEDTLAPSYESKTANVKRILDIDLESPVVLEKEDMVGEVSLHSLENKNEESPHDDVLRNAAETIFAISSSCPKIDSIEASLAESLMWFVDAVSNELTIRDSPKEEMDEFEAMTLQIQETKEEDYMPSPFFPEVQKPEDTITNTLSTRSRRGQSRRGRQRRDFQRDILPGLTSLSRHEVTEDLQTFGGLMRATGHHWVSGLTRRNGTRNGGGRGRRRAMVETVSTATPSPVSTPLVQQISKIEAGLEDRSLTGWGKTTRRPRRQRCPAGNPAMVST